MYSSKRPRRERPCAQLDARGMLSALLIEARTEVLQMQLNGGYVPFTVVARRVLDAVEGADARQLAAALMSHHHELMALLVLCDERLCRTEVELRRWLSGRAAHDVTESTLTQFLRDQYAAHEVRDAPVPEWDLERCPNRRDDCPCASAPLGLLMVCAGLKMQIRRALPAGSFRLLTTGPLATMLPGKASTAASMVRDAVVKTTEHACTAIVHVRGEPGRSASTDRGADLLYASWINCPSVGAMFAWVADVGARVEAAPDASAYMLAMHTTFDAQTPLLL